MNKLTPETCKHLDLLCSECPDRTECNPLAGELQGFHWGGVVAPQDDKSSVLAKAHGETVLPKHAIPDFLRGASKSVS